MIRRAFAIFASLCLVGGGCTSATTGPGPATAASGSNVGDVQVRLYRGVKVTAKDGNVIDWGATSFGVSGDPSTLSLFNNMAEPAKFPCWISFEVTYPGDIPPAPGGVATVTVPAPGIWNAGPWNVTFDNDPPGHWSILRVAIGGASNNQGSTRAAAALHAKRLAGEVQIHDGSSQGCH